MYRLGDKTKISQEIIKLFPVHSIYIEPFCGVGGLYLNKPRISKINLLNDLDKSIHNLWLSIKNSPEDLLEELISTPITEATFNYFKNLETEDSLKLALKFIYLSSFSLFGAGSTFLSGNMIKKDSVISKLNLFLKSEHIQRATFYNKDYQSFLSSLSFVESQESRVFVYCDPPYLSTGNNYNTPKWSSSDLINLIELLISLKYNFAISEFDTTETMEIFNKYNLNTSVIGERRNLQNSKTEMLAYNYKLKSNFLDY